ncbi:MAG TPA: ABC transporter substrate-binding protein [bacterium]|nr:ABC transporter substrate-binding protein [bacterium]
MGNTHSSLILRSLVTAVICLVFLLTGCGGNSDPADAGAAGNGIVVGMGTAPKTLDPRLSTDVASARVQQLVYNSLVRKNIHSDIEPDLAESWEMVNDTTYRFKLRRNVRFHDGSMFDARDVKATFEAVLADTLASPKKAAYEKLASISIIDDYTIIFETTEPFAPFLINMVLGILPESQARNHDPNQAISPVGTGPFQVTRRDGNDTVVLTAFTDHFRGKPAMDRVEFRVVPDDAIRIMELEKGTIDFIENNVPPDAVPQLRENPEVNVMTAPGTSYYYMGFNMRLTDHPTADPRVRRALALALDRESIITHVLGGLASPAVSLLPEGHWAFNTDLAQIPFDPEEAGRLLDAAGYSLHDGGNRFSVEFKVSQNNQSRRLAEIIQAQWATVGVTVNLRSLEWGTFYEDIINGNFECYVLSWVGVTDPDIYFSIFHTDAIPPNGRNRSHYSNPEVDRLLETARVTLDQKRRAEMYREVQVKLQEDLPCISLWHTDNVAVMDSDLTGFRLYPAGDLDSFAGITWQRTP